MSHGRQLNISMSVNSQAKQCVSVQTGETRSYPRKTW